METRIGKWDWDKVNNAIWARPAIEVKALQRIWRAKGFFRFIDIGCGIGRHSLLFAKAGFSVTAVDLSESGVRKLRALAGVEGLVGMDVVVGDSRELPFDDEGFDCALAFQSIYHCDARGILSAISEIRRVLSPGGEFFATFIAKESEYYESRQGLTDDERVRIKREEDGSALPHFFVNEAELRALLEGFEILGLHLEREPAYPGASLHYSVLARLPQ